MHTTTEPQRTQQKAHTKHQPSPSTSLHPTEPSLTLKQTTEPQRPASKSHAMSCHAISLSTHPLSTFHPVSHNPNPQAIKHSVEEPKTSSIGHQVVQRHPVGHAQPQHRGGRATHGSLKTSALRCPAPGTPYPAQVGKAACRHGRRNDGRTDGRTGRCPT